MFYEEFQIQLVGFPDQLNLKIATEKIPIAK